MALGTDRNTPLRNGDLFSVAVAAATTIFAGALVCRNASGWAVPGATALGLRVVGRAESRVANAGANGDVSVLVRRGAFRWGNAEGDPLTAADIGNVCYLVDDETVARTSGSSTRSRAGLVLDVDDVGVWVLTGYGLLDAPGGALLAVNNLSDLGSAAAARAELGTNRLALTLAVPDLSDDGAVHRVVAPRGGTITAIRTVIDGALATGNATLTASIGGDAVTSGVVTIAEGSSAAGDVDLAEPSGANTVIAGDVIELTVGGTNTAGAGATVTLDITF